MKRSSVLNNMQTAVAIKYGSVKFPMALDELMDLLLTTAEDAGMLPPDRSGGGCNDPQCCGGPEHSWDYEPNEKV